MTAEHQYINFIMSHFVGGMFGATPQVLGNGIIVNIFFVHERGRAFAVYSTIFMWGSAAAPTFGDFIVEKVGWPAVYWWTIALQAVMIIVTFLFLEETQYFRNEDGITGKAHSATSWIQGRLATFLPGTKVVHKQSLGKVVSIFAEVVTCRYFEKLSTFLYRCNRRTLRFR